MYDIMRCSICMRNYNGFIRYANVICCDCKNNYGSFDKNGNKIEFNNINECGVVKSITTVGNTEIECNKTLSFINGNKCYVDEGRFCRIFISHIPNQNKRQKNKIKI